MSQKSEKNSILCFVGQEKYIGYCLFMEQNMIIVILSRQNQARRNRYGRYGHGRTTFQPKKKKEKKMYTTQIIIRMKKNHKN